MNETVHHGATIAELGEYVKQVQVEFDRLS